MNNDLHEWDLSWEHFYQTDTTLKRLASFGFALSPWQTVNYVEAPSIGKFEGERFDPRTWRPQTPTTAYLELRDDDAFWAAQRVGAFSDETIRALVHTANSATRQRRRRSPTSSFKRRDKILRTYLPAVNPIVAPRLDSNGRLSFDNAAVAAGVAGPPQTYRASWFEFDNATGTTRPLSATSSATATIDAPNNLPRTVGGFVAVDISAESSEYPSWGNPVRAYFRRDTNDWKLIGFERIPG
jgi:hypothetical protein